MKEVCAMSKIPFSKQNVEGKCVGGGEWMWEGKVWMLQKCIDLLSWKFAMTEKTKIEKKKF